MIKIEARLNFIQEEIDRVKTQLGDIYQRTPSDYILSSIGRIDALHTEIKAIRAAVQNRLIKPIALAKEFHELYEQQSQKVGWKTQTQCQVDFKDLPKENKIAMTYTCSKLLQRYYLVIKED